MMKIKLKIWSFIKITLSLLKICSFIEDDDNIMHKRESRKKPGQATHGTWDDLESSSNMILGHKDKSLGPAGFHLILVTSNLLLALKLSRNLWVSLDIR